MSKERLIKLLRGFEFKCPKDCLSVNYKDCNECRLEQFADYLITSGEVIVPPCKVGDKVYKIVHGEILETEAVGFLVCQDGAILIITRNSFPLTREVGCCVFPTREEAEAKLRKKDESNGKM